MIDKRKKFIFAIFIIVAVAFGGIVSKIKSSQFKIEGEKSNDFASMEAKLPMDIAFADKRYYLKRESQKSYKAEVQIPQIQTSVNNCVSVQINSIIKDVAVSVFDNSYYDFVLHLEDGLQNLNEWVEYEAAYNILQSNDQYISLIFSVLAYNVGAHPYTGSHIATINTKTGQFVHWNDLLDIEKLENILLEDSFQVYEGTYSELSEEDVHDPEIINGLINTLIYSEETENTLNNQKYNPFSCQNIGMDEKYLYIYVRSDMGFQGYFILQIPKALILGEHQEEKQAKITLSNKPYLLKREESLQKNINVKVNYPAVTEPLNSKTAKRINAILRDAAFAPFAETYQEAVAVLEKIEKDFNQWIEAEIHYYILQADKECIRVIYDADIASNKLDLQKKKYLLTIDLTTEQYSLEEVDL